MTIKKLTSVNIGVSGEYKYQKLDAAGHVKEESDWFPNIIVNGGLDRYLNSTSLSLSSCSVGTGTSTPAATDTALDNSIATSSGSATLSNLSYQVSIAPYYVERTYTFNFTLGDVVGNITEVGITHNGSGLFSRALFLDGMGDPTSITVLADEQLRIIYKLRKQAPEIEPTPTVDGYDLIIRPCSFDHSARGWNPLSTHYATSSSTFNWIAKSGSIGSITSTPGGANLGGTADFTWDSYTDGQHYRDVTLSWSTSNGNGTIQSFFIENINSQDGWQFGVDPSIVKTNEDILTISLRYSISRV